MDSITEAPKNVKLEAALEYAERGWPVLPLHHPVETGDNPKCSCKDGYDCERVGKHPRVRNGVKDATTDAGQIGEWWAKWPNANIGIATGAESGFFGLDIDDDKGGSESLADKPSIEAPQAATGNGLHAYLNHPGYRVRNVALHEGVHIRGDGGYLAAPPSLHATGRRYGWIVPPNGRLPEAPEWLLEMLEASAPHQEDAPQDGGVRTDIGEVPRHIRQYVEVALTQEANALAETPEGRRNMTLNKAAYKIGGYVSPGYVSEETVRERLTAAALESGLPKHEVKRTLKSGLEAGMENPRCLDHLSNETLEQLTHLMVLAMQPSTWPNPRTRRSDMGVYLSLIRHAERAGFPEGFAVSQRKLVETSGVSYPTVQKVLTRLEEYDFVSTSKRPGKATVFRLLPPGKEYPTKVNQYTPHWVVTDKVSSGISHKVNHSEAKARTYRELQADDAFLRGAKLRPRGMSKVAPLESLGPIAADIVATLDTYGPMHISALADQAGSTSRTVSRKLDILEHLGLVCIATDDADRRRKQVQLAPEWRAALKEARPRLTTYARTERRRRQHLRDRVKDLRPQVIVQLTDRLKRDGRTEAHATAINLVESMLDMARKGHDDVVQALHEAHFSRVRLGERLVKAVIEHRESEGRIQEMRKKMKDVLGDDAEFYRDNRHQDDIREAKQAMTPEERERIRAITEIMLEEAREAFARRGRPAKKQYGSPFDEDDSAPRYEKPSLRYLGRYGVQVGKAA